jgi:pyruvate-formate lyase-activating enzyme
LDRATPFEAARTLGAGARAKALRILKRTFDRRPLYCTALAGESNYNICVNSDMTVSCNCQDYDGQGHIGDLRTQTLAEIVSGEAVAGFQSMLYAREMPTSVCSTCPELAVLPRETARLGPAPGGIPIHGLMVENTVLCNLRCSLCRRDELLAQRGQRSMTLEDIERVAKMVSEYGIEQVSYFALGEPFVSQHIDEEIALMRQHNPEITIVTSTNGALVDTESKLSALLMMDHVYFSIDGTTQDTVSRYQVNGDFEKSFANMSRLVERRAQRLADDPEAHVPTIEWKYVVFRWNDSREEILRAIRLAREAAVDRIVFYPGVAKRPDRSVRFHTDPLFASLGEVVNGGVVVDLTARADPETGDATA